jgi:hypothetical protein
MRLQARRLRQQLDTVCGREQMTMRILGSPSRPPARSRQSSPGPHERAEADASGVAGTEYLRARAGKQVPSEIRPLLDAVAALVHDTRVERNTADAVNITVYQLIDRGQSESYKAAVHAGARAMAECRIRVTGPAPCYAFS